MLTAFNLYLRPTSAEAQAPDVLGVVLVQRADVFAFVVVLQLLVRELRRRVAAQVEFERHILKPGLMFKGKGLKPGAFQLWVRGSQRAPPHRGGRQKRRSRGIDGGGATYDA